MNFIQQAYKGENEWWKYLIALTVVMSPFILNFVLYLLLPEIFEKIYEDLENFQGNKNVFLLENLVPFVVLLAILLLFVRYLHQRSIVSLITSRLKIDWYRVIYAFVLWLAISMVFLAIGFFTDSENLIWNFKPIPFFILVIISLVFLPLQTSFEELLFRGYLMQGIGILVKNRWFPLLITSVLFGLLHGLNPEVEKLGYGIMVFYIGTGLLFGIVTLMDEGTEIALGLHAANNIVAALFITSSWAAFQTDALYIDTSEPVLDWTAYTPVFVVYPILIFILSRKYGWTNWSEKLFGKIVKPQITDE